MSLTLLYQYNNSPPDEWETLMECELGHGDMEETEEMHEMEETPEKNRYELLQKQLFDFRRSDFRRTPGRPRR